MLFADFKDSLELIRGLDPEAAQQLLDPALHAMMDAVHRYEGTGGARGGTHYPGQGDGSRCYARHRSSRNTSPVLLALLDALPAGQPFTANLMPPQRRQHTLTALKRVLLRQSQVQPLLLVCEDLHWLDTETQALLESRGESLPTARLLLLGELPAGLPAWLGEQDLLHATAAGPLAPSECRRLPPGPSWGMPRA